MQKKSCSWLSVRPSYIIKASINTSRLNRKRNSIIKISYLFFFFFQRNETVWPHPRTSNKDVYLKLLMFTINCVSQRWHFLLLCFSSLRHFHSILDSLMADRTLPLTQTLWTQSNRAAFDTHKNYGKVPTSVNHISQTQTPIISLWDFSVLCGKCFGNDLKSSLPLPYT